MAETMDWVKIQSHNIGADKTADSISVHALRSKPRASRGKQTNADNTANEVKMRHVHKIKLMKQPLL